MTDRINALTVVLDVDRREDDCEALVTAIRQLRGVASVSMNVADYRDHIAHERARRDLSDRLWRVLYPNLEKA